uniref:Uncharacterized protein n=1 Tax=Ackermannviridae sp. ctaCq7 TaxID=2827294 RepID=A0A8S5R5E8_9CAUD|nr:MAG TPA: hypothetical protein [Ackermannviridae sp. ctaCq7]
MTKIIFVLIILVVWIFITFIVPKLKENHQKKLDKLTKIQYKAYLYYSDNGKDALMQELILENIEYWENRYINKLYSTMLKIKVINNELNQKILFDKAKENYHSQNLGELELIYKQMKKNKEFRKF